MTLTAQDPGGLPGPSGPGGDAAGAGDSAGTTATAGTATVTADDAAEPAAEPAGADAPGTDDRRGWRAWRPPRPSWATLLLAAVAYLPLLRTSPGRIGADTKAYLYLDPGRLLRRAVSMWDPDVGMGTVTHQNIGYLFPQGLWYYVLDLVGLPDWVAQRLWTGTILFVAGAGVLFLLRSFGWPDRYSVVAAFGYMLTPYSLEYEARISAILLPYAGLGWFIGITVRGLREAREGKGSWRGADAWRWPAAFALVVTSVGSINASSLILIMLAPLLWLPFAVWGTREATLRATGGLISRAVIMTILANAWWVAGLYTQAGYGLNVLAFTETVKTVASSSQASEVLRGLGNWFFYGEDALGPWVTPAVGYTQALWLLMVSFAVPLLGLAAASLIRWGHRAYFVGLVVLGTTVAVGVYPYDNPSPLGRFFRDFAEGSTAGLALRSLPRAAPLVVLGLSVLLAGAIAAFTERSMAQAAARRSSAGGAGRAARGRRRRRRMVFRARPGSVLPTAVTVVVLALLALDMAPLFRGQFLEPGLQRPEDVPDYELALADALNAKGNATRVLELPGADFAHYRWGSTLDTVTYGLMDRPTVQRELIPYGEAGSTDLVRSLDRRLQEGVFETSSLYDVARLMGVGDVVLRGNNQYERFRGPRPRADWDLFTSRPPNGLEKPTVYGPLVSETTTIPYLDEITLGTDPAVPDPPTLADFAVKDPTPIVRTATTGRPLLVSGNGEALVDAAASGLLTDVVDNNRTVLYTGALAGDRDGMRQALADGAELLLSDSNRLRAERWTGIRENFGYVEQPGVTPLAKDPDDNRLPLFPAQDTSDQTVAVLAAPGEQAQVAAVTASSYGNTFAYGPADRPVHAIDADPTTAWRVGAFTDPAGERWQTTLAAPTTTDHIRLVQPLTGPRNRWITKVTLTFDGGSPVTADLIDGSRTGQGQVITFPERTFKTLTIRVDATNYGKQKSYDGLSAVGLAEVEIPKADAKPAVAQDLLRMPTDLLTTAGQGSLDHPLVLTMTRDRANPAEPFKEDTESTIARVFSLPTDRAFSLTGTARLSSYASDDVIDKLLGRPDGPPLVVSSGRLPGDIDARGSAAFDGDTATAWSPGFGDQSGNWLQLTSLDDVTLSTAELTLVTDGRHSVPTKLGVEVDGQRAGTVDVPPLADAAGKRGATTTVTVPLPVGSGHQIRFVVDAVRPVTTKDTISGAIMTTPVGIAEIELPGVKGTGQTASTAQPPADLSVGCRTDLLTVDGQPVGVRINGTTKDASGRLGLDVRTCGTPVRLSAGDHVVRTANGAKTGIDLDRLVFASDAGGTTWPDATSINALDTSREQRTADLAAQSGNVAGTAATTPATPTVKVDVAGPTTFVLTVTGAKPGTPFWLVLGQSLSPGWHGKIDENTDIGSPQLVDGYADGWRIDPESETFKVQLTWTPQRVVFAALTVSVVTVVLCLALLGVTGRRRRKAGWPAAPVRDLPRLDRPFAATPRLPLRQVAPLVLGTAAIGAFIVSPAAGAATAAVTLVAALAPRGRVLLRAGSVAALAAAAAYVIEVQVRYNLSVNGSWVSEFDKVATVSWLAVLFLGADAALALLHGHASRRAAEAEGRDGAQDEDEAGGTVPPPDAAAGAETEPSAR
ncbi:alpha-(1-_3)-arabinofuranosyltransferase family protein [Pseudofrankia sp. BMG5.37]|uniref:alpha-(1->3)-arabinofuranosyltransferase domain-containing protein n=1 Tax=Pseudofrankia sp. BMG5.37 TaxID=3050035 RepID=UPI0028954AE7|nr:alpha-(1->3)-arabinofuranosyltransferase family protein [Pseudofrankia sp. BMG5.37]MDT3438297.1 alpha-(1->3)-arabinofuranosyltransferase family protein [Pseudofrankia sp. BMG5.37]